MSYKQYQTFNKATLFHDKIIKSFAYLQGLTPRQFQILTLLKDGEVDTATDIMKNTGLSKATLSGVIEKLEARGLIARKGDEHDNRVKHIRLRTNGYIACEDVERAYIEWMVSNISRRKRKKLCKLLRKIMTLEN